MTQRVCDDCYYSKLDGNKEPCSSCIATVDGFTNWRKAPQTNADKIRAMSDEELSKVIREPFCDKRTHEECTISYCGVCDQCVLDWLQQPAE